MRIGPKQAGHEVTTPFKGPYIIMSWICRIPSVSQLGRDPGIRNFMYQLKLLVQHGGDDEGMDNDTDKLLEDRPVQVLLLI